jgi:hypothetical protein
MSYWRRRRIGTAPVLQEKSGGLPTATTVRKMIKGMIPSATENEFYEIEMGEVISVILDEDELPLITRPYSLEHYMKNPHLFSGEKDWSKFGSAVVRMVNSEKDLPLNNIGSVRPLFANSHPYPVRGEYVAVVRFNEQNFYINVLNLFDNVNNNISPGFSGVRPEDIVEEDFIYEHFEPDPEIRNLWPHQGDSILQGRWGNSIRLGSNITPDAHEDGDGKPDSPNILIRAGQLVDADTFGKSGIVQDLKESPKKPVEEDINADGSSIWMTTDQSVKLDIKGSNAVNHVFMTTKQSDDQPKNGGKQIVLNSDRITFNTKQGKILGFSHDGIGFSTQKSFTIDADETVDMNVGGGSGGPGSTLSITDSSLLMTSPTNAGLSIGTDRSILSSPCPSILTLADYANITSCKGAILHLDDCAGLKDNQGSFIRIGGKAQGITGYVKDRDDMGQQHLVYGEALTDILDELITSILNITAIPTGAGPSGPISATPSLADFESIRAKLCDLLMKPE